jgi:hypothetical protein
MIPAFAFLGIGFKKRLTTPALGMPAGKEKTMSTERKQVLEMLVQGKITAEEADRLIERLAASEESHEDRGEGATGPASRPQNPRFLRVVVDSKDGDKVNIRVPLALVRTGIKLSAMLPAQASEKLNAKGIDLTQLSSLKGEDLANALRELSVDVDSTQGDKVRIFCE